jgi:hypothetical protein
LSVIADCAIVERSATEANMKPRNPEAMGLKSGQFKPKVVPNKKAYDRKKATKPKQED